MKLTAVRSLGCFFVSSPYFFVIFRTFGTPTEQTWPGISKLPDFNPHTPKWRPIAKHGLHKVLKQKLDVQGCELLQQTFTFAPCKRPTCNQALTHSWFDSIREEFISEYGNVYPHCGSREYQIHKIRKLLIQQQTHTQTNTNASTKTDSSKDNHNNNNNNHTKSRKRARVPFQQRNDDNINIISRRRYNNDENTANVDKVCVASKNNNIDSASIRLMENQI
jgi:serine/threonine protein kinase